MQDAGDGTQGGVDGTVGVQRDPGDDGGGVAGPWPTAAASEFKGALQTLQAYEPALREGSRSQRAWLWGIMLESIARDEVGHRPDRVEPRARKRRPKPYPLLMVPREEAKEALSKAG